MTSKKSTKLSKKSSAALHKIRVHEFTGDLHRVAIELIEQVKLCKLKVLSIQTLASAELNVSHTLELSIAGKLQTVKLDRYPAPAGEQPPKVSTRCEDDNGEIGLLATYFDD